MRTSRPALVATVLALIGAVLTLGPPSASDAAGVPTRHYIANQGGSTRPAALGFGLFDIGSSTGLINALPAKVQGLVYLGQQCPTRADAAFRRTVRGLANNPKVFGYYLSDEPHIRDCPRGPAGLASRADYIRTVTHGRQKNFIAINQSSADWSAGFRDTHAFRPAVTHVDLFGIVSYPCSVGGCDFTKIPYKVGLARRGGIPLAAIVPVYQAFGQEKASAEKYYRMPTAAQERSLLATWRKAVPNPVMDYTYGWAHQDSANPTLVDRTDLQSVFARFFGG